ncbi:MAG: hypothetical protein ACM3MG_09795 [Bacillota bacterium]
METFKPAQAPLWKRVIGSPLLQLSILFLLAGTAGFYIYQKGQDNLHNRVTYLKSPVQFNRASDVQIAVKASDKSETQTEPINADLKSDETTSAEAASLTQTTTTPNPSPTTTASPEKNKDATRSTAKLDSPHLVVYYAEVPRRVLMRLLEASRGTGQFMSFTDYTAGILPNATKHINGDGVKILHREEHAVEPAKTLQWFYGIKDRRNPNNEIGMTTFFELADIDNNTLRGNLEIQRSWRDPIPTGGFEVQRKSFPAIFEIGGNTGFFMAGVMPPQSNLENDDELTAIDIYKILRSAMFRSGDSEFVIFIEFIKP